MKELRSLNRLILESKGGKTNKGLVVEDGVLVKARKSIKGEVYIEEGIRKIGDSAFEKCEGITDVKFTYIDGVEVIGKKAFYSCINLKSITLPRSLKSIRSGAFFDCRELEYIEIPRYVTEFGSSMFAYSSGLVSVDFITDDIDTLGENTFLGCYELKRVLLPGNLKTIGIRAFGNCRSLTSIEIPKRVTSIAYEAFRDCKSLKNVVVPDSIEEIHPYSFTGCYSIESISVPNKKDIIDFFLKYVIDVSGISEDVLKIRG